MKRLSKGEETMALHIRAHKLPDPEREYKFHPTRKWLFDFCWPDKKVACEVDGGTRGFWNKKTGVLMFGDHATGQGVDDDNEKRNTAQLMGWMVLRVTTKQVQSGEAVQWVKQALGE